MDCRLPKLPLIVWTKCKPLTDKITNYSNAGNCFPSGFKSFFMGVLIPLDVVCIHLASKTNRSVSASSLLMTFLIGVSYSSWVLMRFLRKFKWSFLPWNKCTCRISVCFLKVFFWMEYLCRRTYVEKNPHSGGGGEWKKVVSRYNWTLSNTCSSNLMPFFFCFCNCIPAEMLFYDSQKTFSKLFMYFKRFALLWVLPFFFFFLAVNNVVRNLSLPALCLWISSWRA